MSITPISFPTGALPGVEGLTPTAGPAATSEVAGSDFGSVLAATADQLQGLHSTADTLAVKAATGDLRDVHDYTIASTEAALSTDMVVTLRNKAVEAFTEIMRMPI